MNTYPENMTFRVMKSKTFMEAYIPKFHLFDTVYGATLTCTRKETNERVTVCARDWDSGFQKDTPEIWNFKHANLTDYVSLMIDEETKLYCNVSTDPVGMDVRSFVSMYKFDDNVLRKNVQFVMKKLSNLFENLLENNIGMLPLREKAIILTVKGDMITDIKVRRNLLCRDGTLADAKANLLNVARMFCDLYDDIEECDLMCQPEVPFFQGLRPSSDMTLRELLTLPYMNVEMKDWTEEEMVIGIQPAKAVAHEAEPEAEKDEEYNSEDDKDYVEDDDEWECDCSEGESCHCETDSEDSEDSDEDVSDDDDALSVHTAIESDSELNRSTEFEMISSQAEDETRSEYAFEQQGYNADAVVDTTGDDDEVKSVYAFEYQGYSADLDADANVDDNEVKSVYAFDAKDADVQSEYAFNLDDYEDVHSVYAFDADEAMTVHSAAEIEELDDDVRSEYAFEYQEKKNPPSSTTSTYNDTHTYWHSERQRTCVWGEPAGKAVVGCGFF